MIPLRGSLGLRLRSMKKNNSSVLHIMLWLTVLLGVSWHNKEPKLNASSGWAEAQKRNYFVDSFAYADGSGRWPEMLGGDSARTFATFFRRQYPNNHSAYYVDPLPYALEEEYIDTTRIDSSREWLRFIVYPFLDLPYSLVLERNAGRTYLTAKLTDGRGRYSTGQLILTSKHELNDSLTNSIFNTLDSLNFWRLTQDTSCHGGLDGNVWQIEAMVKGNYNCVERWEPDHCGNLVSGRLAELGNELYVRCDLRSLVQVCDKRRLWMTRIDKRF